MDKNHKTIVTKDNSKSNDNLIIEEMRKRKLEFGYSYEEIAKRSGLPLGTVQKVLGGFTKRPRHATLSALASVLLPEKSLFPADSADSADSNSHTSDKSDNTKNPGKKRVFTGIAGVGYAGREAYPGLLQESAPVYITGHTQDAGMKKKPVKHTIADRNALPEDHPSELIDGVIYNMASPSARHQIISGAVHQQLWNYVDSHGGESIPFIAPTDVRLDRDDYTMLVPDVFVICDPGNHMSKDDRYIDGAPDLVIEILSPATRGKDMFIKLEKYRNAGVREYWIVDPKKEKVIVYLFGEEPDVGLYGFDSKIPVGIFNGDCKIDFTEIVRKLNMLDKIRGKNG